MFEYKSEKSVIDFSAKEHSKTLGRLKVVEDFEWQVAVESQGNPGYKEYITKYEQVRKNGLFFLFSCLKYNR